MPADRLTKVLLKAKLDQFICQCNLVDVPEAPTPEAFTFIPTLTP